MSRKAGFPYALLLSMLVADAGLCLEPLRADPTGNNPPTAAVVPPSPDPLILRECPGCCGPVGKNGPIAYEWYLRAGPSLPLGGTGGLANTVETGWLIQGGGRSLFFNP